jgi:hypothetical protein
VLQWGRGLISGWFNPQGLSSLRPAMPAPLRGRINTATHTDLYRVLRAYYYSNALYDVLRDVLRRQGVWGEALKPLRNPTYRVVEFHAGHLWPGTLPEALPIMADHKQIIDPIQQVWKWSNWNGGKQVAARHLALYGDSFIKVAQTPNQKRVYFENIEPEHVTDFDADERGNLTFVRFDFPMLRRDDKGKTEPYLHTEVWNLKTGWYRVYETDSQAQTSLEQLGNPVTELEIASMGIDFIPVVHAKFSDIGEDRGMGAVMPALDKIDEANRQATRLAQLLFRNNNVVWALKANSVDASGRPLPPPRINDTDGTTDDDGTVHIGDDKILKLPGMSELQSLVPNINYEAALHVLQDHMIELEQDLPELVMYRLSESSALSGRAVRLMLAPAIARLEEARGNGEAAIIKADQMALTMGANAGLWSVGDFEAGDFEHTFEERDVLPSDKLEDAQADQAEGAAIQSLVAAGVPVEMAIMMVKGWTEERAAQFTVERLAAIQREQALAQEDVVAGDTGGNSPPAPAGAGQPGGGQGSPPSGTPANRS